jgi:hypothetical protein
MVQVRRSKDHPDTFYVDDDTNDLTLDQAVEYVLSNPLPFDEHDDPGSESFEPECPYWEEGDGGFQTADEYDEFCNSGCSLVTDDTEEPDDLNDEGDELPSY